jgi:hypothetical protein
MIQVEIIDRDGDQCSLGDVIILHFPADKYKYIGLLEYSDKAKCFRLSDGDGGWKALTESHATFERLCPFSIWPGAEKFFGRIELNKKLTLQSIYNMVFDAQEVKEDCKCDGVITTTCENNRCFKICVNCLKEQ